ncbi:MAG TPA: hypothetical protein VMV47_01845 [Bacteroidales bacterium]|nr:hypothetical protein [Bacteroidales bacterium]
MGNLTLVHRGQSISKKIASGLFIVFAIIILILGRGSLEIKDWIRTILFFLMGVYFITRVSGFNKVQIEIKEGSLKIMWINRIREVTIQETEIENIILSGKNILISRKGKKPLRLELFSLSIEQKTKIFEFLIEYARQKNIALKK